MSAGTLREDALDAIEANLPRVVALVLGGSICLDKGADLSNGAVKAATYWNLRNCHEELIEHGNTFLSIKQLQRTADGVENFDQLMTLTDRPA